MTSYIQNTDTSSSHSFFGVFIDDITHSVNSTPYIFEDVDLFYQPVETPLVASLFFLVRSILFFISEFINVKIFLQLKKETCLINDVARVFTCTQMVILPFWLLYNTSTDFFHPMNEIIGNWFCTLGWFSIHLCGTIIAFHSFVVALMRYLFIVHDRKIENFGKKKAKKVIMYLTFIIPLLVVIWEGTNGSDLDVISVVNKCYGKDHKVFLIETSTSEVFKSKFCEYDGYDDQDGGSAFFKIVAIFRRISCIANKVVMVIMSVNIAEGIIYFKLLSHINRYLKFF